MQPGTTGQAKFKRAQQPKQKSAACPHYPPATAAGSTCCVVARLAPRCMGAPPPVECPLASMKAGRQATMAVARVGPGQAQVEGSASYSSSSCRGIKGCDNNAD